MSEPTPPRPRQEAQRRRRSIRLEPIQELEERKLLAPYLPITARTATFTPLANQPNTQNLGTFNINIGSPLTTSAAAYTSVAQFAPISQFGGNIVRIEAGPGGDFGKGVYAVTRGAGDNAGLPGVVSRPGLIYRVDPATGKASVFFDLNSVINQIEPGGNASNGLLPSTGLLNWYDIAFDPEGYFDGRSSMFVSSVDATDPNKNVVFRIGSDGSFLGAYTKFTNTGTGVFNRAPTAVLVPPPEQQTYLRGLMVGTGLDLGTTTPGNGGLTSPYGNFPVLFFNANAFRPGQDAGGLVLPPGATETALTVGPQTALVSSNHDYASPVYSTFSNFGIPAAGGLPGAPGVSGVQGLGGELLIRAPGSNLTTTIFGIAGGSSNFNFPIGPLPTADVTLAGTQASGAAPSGVDQFSAITTPYRRFQDAAFDQYGYFSYGTTVTQGASGAPPTAGAAPIYAGNMFVADLASGLAATVPLPASVTPAGSLVLPVQGPGVGGLQDTPQGGKYTLPGGNLGGRIIRITPNGTVSTFAEGFHTNGSYDSDSFANSSLSITFSADGTTLYAADDDGIWQFKTVTSLANSTSGSLIGLNDLRTLGVPYEGQDSAVAIVDTGIDARVPSFRGRVAPGKNILNSGFGNDDLAPFSGGTGGGTATGVNTDNGHGTLVAGVVAQFVPQATLVPVNIFGTQAATATGGGTTNDLVYNGMDYLIKTPFTVDPIRYDTADRIVTAAFGFGTQQTFDTEGTAFRKYPQIVASFANQMVKLRKLGIQPIAAAGQLGTPVGGTNPNGATAGDFNGMALPAILNEAISVTGSYPFPFTATALTPPTDPSPGPLGRPPGPLLLTGLTNAVVGGNAATLAAGDIVIFSDKILFSSNRSTTTDFTAPEMDLPTFGRTGAITTGTTPATSTGGHMVFTEAGTSLSSGVVTGAYALVASALDYWSNLSKTGVTVDGYLTTPVGVNQLNFGPHQVYDLSPYANPDGINSILQWTAVPAQDSDIIDDTGVLSAPPTLFGGVHAREISRVDVGNAVGAIEATEALNYLIGKNQLGLLDANNDGMVTAQEVQNFTDTAAHVGLAEAGAMARMLGGTGRTGNVSVNGVSPDLAFAQTTIITGSGQTALGETPDQPDALQRRFNLLDYAADGQLNGGVTLDQLRVLAHTLLPAPDAFSVVDRQRASVNGYLLDPKPFRNYSDLQHLKPTYAFVPPYQLRRFRNISPARFGVNRGIPARLQNPAYTLFDKSSTKVEKKHTAKPVDPPKVVTPAVEAPTIQTPATTQTNTTTTQTNTTDQAPTSSTFNPAGATPGANGLLGLLAQGIKASSATPAASAGDTQLKTPSQVAAPQNASGARNLAAVPAGKLAPTSTSANTPTAVATDTTTSDANRTVARRALIQNQSNQKKNLLDQIGNTVKGWFGK
ncbi:MAG: S8 family serine peptidase [Isosphaeraceae bacterium]